jgi:hypothetical protein
VQICHDWGQKGLTCSTLADDDDDEEEEEKAEEEWFLSQKSHCISITKTG